jgi:hypothetical protein
MANPQHEDGSIKIAYDLYAAIIRADITSFEYRMFLAIIALSYGQFKVRAKMSIEDIRALMGNSKTNRLDRSLKAFSVLQTLNMITVSEREEGLIVGPQKDYDRWLDKSQIDGFVEASGQNVRVLRTILDKYIYINSKLRFKPDKMSAADALLVYAYADHPYKLSSKQHGVEKAVVTDLWGQALARVRDPDQAYSLLIDFIDDMQNNPKDLNYKAKVKMQFKYLERNFRQYLAGIPEKKLDTIRDEKALGVRHKYDLKAKRWVPTKDKIGG